MMSVDLNGDDGGIIMKLCCAVSGSGDLCSYHSYVERCVVCARIFRWVALADAMCAVCVTYSIWIEVNRFVER